MFWIVNSVTDGYSLIDLHNIMSGNTTIICIGVCMFNKKLFLKSIFKLIYAATGIEPVPSANETDDLPLIYGKIKHLQLKMANHMFPR